jgi:hypothetical protein
MEGVKPFSPSLGVISAVGFCEHTFLR